MVLIGACFERIITLYKNLAVLAKGVCQVLTL
jgi:hypothetical protein